MLKTIHGVVISSTNYQESSKIINVLTEDGIYGILSKGCRNVKSPLRLISNKLTYAEFIIYEKTDGLSTLKEGSVIDDFKNIQKDIKAMSYYIYMTDLVNQVYKHDNNKNIFSLYLNAVKKIDEGLDPKVMCNILEIKLLDYLGVPIELNACCKCGGTKNIITIDPDAGGYICESCYTDEIIYDAKVRKMLRMYYLVDIESIKELKINDYVVEAINRFLSIYYDRYTGLYLKSKSFLNEL